MKKIYITTAALFILGVGFALFSISKPSQPSVDNNSVENSTIAAEEKIYVALEEEGKVAVIDSTSRKVLSTIDLSKQIDGKMTHFMAHNVQVAPNGQFVAVTANIAEDMEGMPGASMETHGNSSDELVIINPETDQITQRIPLDTDSHLAHVVIPKDGKKAYATSQEKGLVYIVDIVNGRIANKVNLGQDTQPHGLRLSNDDSKAFIALMGKGLAVMDTASGQFNTIKLPGAGVQTAITQDGKFAFVSVYDTKQIGFLDLATNKLEFIQLPEGAKGPVQLYVSPDSRYLYVADQGYYFDQPTSDKIYRIDIAMRKVDKTITGGSAPHGIVVDKAGEFAFVTNLLSDDISVIDLASNQEVSKIPVGNMPNGISVWNKNKGGTP